IKFDVLQVVTRVKVQSAEDAEKIEAARREQEAKTKVTTNMAGVESGSEESAGDVPRVGRNEPCPCGSGKKYKQCHGSLV
ncbi:MAG: SEC-C metal-binding domain-containing protein, partial [Marinomonas gallaica]